MNPNTGEIFSSDDIYKLIKEQGRKQALFDKIPISEKQYRKLTPMNANERKGWMRNQPCFCGSSRKFKKCCWSKFNGS